MRIRTRALGALSFVASVVSAQGPGGPPMGGGRPGPAMMAGNPSGPIAATADFLLAHTGDLALTDAQVVRLAAISRRTNTRRTSLMARMDSARAAARPAPGDSGGRGRRPGPPPAADLQAMREQRAQVHADVRDAIAVLTPDQQATAWMMVAGGPALGSGPPGPGGAMRPRFGQGPGGDDARPADRGPISRPPAPRDVPRRPDGGANSQP